ADDLVVVETGGGGGYGRPDQRPVETVMRDLRSGLISPESAQRDYDVVLAPDGSARRADDRGVTRRGPGAS
ncbi:MAG: hypothetical protein ACREFL_10010, partial [Stellaceae bacterium]